MKRATKLGYGIGIYGPMLGWVAALQWLMYFYTEVVGLNPAAAGLIFMVGMVWDAISDPGIGLLADRTRTRWGRYRPYLLFGSVPFAAAIAFLFFNPPLAAGSDSLMGFSPAFWIALATHLLFRTGYTVVYMPYTAMIARMTPDYDTRTSLVGYKTMFVFAGNLTVSFLFYKLVLALGDGQESAGFFPAAAVVGSIAALTSLICFAVVRERNNQADASAKPETGIFSAARDLGRNRPFLMVFGCTALIGGFYGAELTMVAYYAKYWLGDPSRTSDIFVTQAIAAIISIPLWQWVARRFGKARVWIAGNCVSAACLIAIFLLRPEDWRIMAALYGVANVGATAFIMIFYAMTADTVDWGEANTGARHEGIVFGAVSFANKFAAGVATGLVGSGLAAAGFVANQQPSAGTMDAMFAIGLLMPAFAFIAGAIILLAYPIGREEHAALLARIKSC